MNSHQTNEGQSLYIRDPQFKCAQTWLRTGSLLLIAVAVLVLVALPNASFAQSVLTDDAQTSTAPRSTDSNFGTNPNLNVSAAGNVYLKFKLSSTLPAGTPGSEVERATLKLYIGNIMTAGKLDVYAVAGAWDESSITDNNAPPLGNLLATTAQIGTDRRHKFLVIDITSIAKQWLGDDGQGTNGLPNHGIALIAHPTDATTPEVASITFDSKENSQTSHEAQLNVQLDLAADGLQKVEHDASLTGDGTSALPLGVADGGINSAHLANDAVTAEKIADNAVSTTELADGSVTSAKVTAPLSLTSADAGFTLSVTNTGAGAAIKAGGAIDTTTQYNIGGSRILSNAGTNNLFAGTDAGTSNTAGTANAFFGKNSGHGNTTGSSNSFVGYNAGAGNTTGRNNSFVGDAAGFINAAGNDNSFFGFLAGFHNTANNNSFFGSLAGADNTTGGNNSFFGVRAGVNNTTGGLNSFFGAGAGSRNTEGGSNSFFGQAAGINNTTGASNSFFGLNSGVSNTEGGANSFFGLQAGFANTTGSRNTFVGWSAGSSNRTGNNNTVVGYFAEVGADDLSFATAVGAGSVVASNDTVVLGRTVDKVEVPGALNVGGTFGANILNATTQFNLGGSRVLSSNSAAANLFIGQNSGQSNQTGTGNLFLGQSAGQSNTTGGVNTFIGQFAGQSNSSGTFNSFLGNLTGVSNTSGCCNNFFGNSAGAANTQGSVNSFFGGSAGLNNTIGSGNAFFGDRAGQSNTTGGSNSFFGVGTGDGNTTGSNVTLIGTSANVGAVNLTFATAIGSGAVVSTTNTVVLGRSADTVQIPGALSIAGTFGANTLNAAIQFNLGGARMLSRPGVDNLFAGVLAGPNNPTGSGNSFYGLLAGSSSTSASDNSFFGRRAGSVTTGSGNSFFGSMAGANGAGPGSNNTFIGHGADIDITQSPGSNNTALGANAKIATISNGNDLRFATAIGAGAAVEFSDMIVLGKSAGTYDGVVRPADIVRTRGIFQPALSSPGGSPVCFNNGLSLCSSSLRYKTGIQHYLGGVDVAKRLNPITFAWKEDGRRDIGFGAEEVAKVEPLLTFTNEKGEIEGVHYAQITTVLVNAIKEQQAQIEAQQEQIKQQQQQIEALKQSFSTRRGNGRILKRAARQSPPEPELSR